MRNILSEKKGVGILAVFLIVILVLGAGVGIWAVANSVGGGGDKTSKDCETEPYFTLAGVNATNPGDLLPTATYYYRMGGVYKGTLTSGSSGTTFSKGDKVEILSSISDHLDKILGTYDVLKCGSNDVSYQMYGSDAGVFTVYNSGGDALSDAYTGGANNQTTSATAITQRMELVSTAEDSIDPTWIVIEASNTSQVDDIRLGALSSWLTVEPMDVPEFKTSENTTTTSITKAFRVSGLKPDGLVNELSLRLDPESGETIDVVSVYINGYTEQAFVDRDGTFKTGIEDSDGNTKYEDNWDFDYHIT